MSSQPVGTKKLPVTAQKKTILKTVRNTAIPPAKKAVPAPYKLIADNSVTANALKKPVANNAQTKLLPAPAKKSPPQQQSWLTRGINAASSGIGSAASAVVTAAGNGVAGAGKGAGSSITISSRGWADAVREYGNSIKDYTGAGGSRATTKSNPLGLSPGGGTGSTGIKSTSSVRTGTASNPLGL